MTQARNAADVALLASVVVTNLWIALHRQPLVDSIALACVSVVALCAVLVYRKAEQRQPDLVSALMAQFRKELLLSKLPKSKGARMPLTVDAIVADVSSALAAEFATNLDPNAAVPAGMDVHAELLARLKATIDPNSLPARVSPTTVNSALDKLATHILAQYQSQAHALGDIISADLNGAFAQIAF